MQREAEAARAAGLPVEPTESIDLPYSVAGAVRLDDRLEFHPVRYASGLAAAVNGDGSAVFEHTRVVGVSQGSPSRVRTESGGTVRAQHVVVATHYPLLDRGVFFARLEATRSYCIAARVAGAVSTGLSISAGSPTRSIRSYGELLIVGGESHPAGATDATPERYARLERFAREHWDVQEVTHRWSPRTVELRPAAGDRPVRSAGAAAVCGVRVYEVGPDQRHIRRHDHQRPDRRSDEPMGTDLPAEPVRAQVAAHVGPPERQGGRRDGR